MSRSNFKNMYCPTYQNKAFRGSNEPVVSYEITAKPTASAVLLEEAKTYMNVDFDDDDVLIQSLIFSAELFVEKWTGWALGSKTINVYCDSDGVGWLPLIPVDSSVTKINRDQWQATSGTTTMTVGFTSDNIPEDLKLAVLKLVATAYENREDNNTSTVNAGTLTTNIPFNSDDIIKPLRRRVGI